MMRTLLNPNGKVYTLANGWTKETIKQQFRKHNNGSPAIVEGACKYSTSEGNRCAIGVFIPDNHIALTYTGHSYSLFVTHPDLLRHMPIVDLDGLSDLQSLHDDWHDSEHSLPVSLYERLDWWVDNCTQVKE